MNALHKVRRRNDRNTFRTHLQNLRQLNWHAAVTDFNLKIRGKEFIVFVGPSGCCKSSTLRMVAGLEDISKGELYIDDTLMNDVSSKDHDISMVLKLRK